MKLYQLFLIIFFALFSVTEVFAQSKTATRILAGNMNVSFANAETASVDSARFDGAVNTIIVQRDGKIIIGGNFFTYNKISSRGIIRLNPDGSIDKSFAVGTGLNGEVNAIALQPDGKIIAGGKFSNYNGAGNSCNRIVRLNSDGSFDNSFAISIGFQGQVFALVLQPDGKIIVGGMLVKFNSIGCDGLVRLNSNGSLDQNFVYIKGISGYVYCITLLPGGKIMAAGYFGHFDRTLSYGIVRLYNNGSLDSSFVVNKGFGSGTVLAMVAQPNGKVIAAGSFINYNSIPCKNIARLNVDGSLDNSFTVPGKPLKEYSGYGILALAMQPDGKIIAGGKFDYYNSTLRQGIVRLNADGSLDNSFGGETGFDTNGRGAAAINAIAFTQEGNILMGGVYKRYDQALRNNITAVDRNGKLVEPVFHVSTGFNNPINMIAEK